MRGKLQVVRSLFLSEMTVLLTAVVLLVSVSHPVSAIQTVEISDVPSPVSTTYLNLAAFPRLTESNSVSSPVVIEDSLLKSPDPYDGHRFDCENQPCIALSFDDGPNPDTTAQVLTTLEQKGVRASFFLLGQRVKGNETIIQRMAADGFEVGNHTWDHHDMTTMTPEQIQAEILSTQAALISAGAPTPTLFRPPYGAVSPEVVSKAGLQMALWNVDPEDWRATDPAALAQTVVASAHPGAVVDLHDIHSVTVAALPIIIDALKAKNYQFVTVSQLLHSRDRPGNEPFYGYAASSYAPHP